MVGANEATNSPRTTVKVAIVGSGLAGLSAAYYLSKENERRSREGCGPLFDVHLFEKAHALGMDSASISIPSNDGKLVRVDVPMRSFQEAYYSNLVKLYREIGVSFRPAHFTYSFSTIRDSLLKGRVEEEPWLETTLLYNGRSGFKGVSRPASSSRVDCVGGALPLLGYFVAFVFSTFFLVLNYLRLLFLSVPHRLWAPSTTERLDEWMRRTTPRSRISRQLGLDESWTRFIAEVVVPLFSCVCTSTMEDVWSMPVEEVLDYIWRGLGTPNYVALHGVQDVVTRLSALLNPKNIHLSSTITSITPDLSNNSCASIHFVRSGNTEEASPDVCVTINGFSHVIIATQANQAIPILSTYVASMPTQPSSNPVYDVLRCLRTFEYRRNIVVNHTDDRLAPPNPLDRRILNFIRLETKSPLTSSSICVSQSYAMATHIVYPSPSLSSSPSSSPTSIYQTTNPIFPPRPSSVLSIARMERAIVTVESKLALQDLFCDAVEGEMELESRWTWLGLKKKRGRKTLGPLQGVRPDARENCVEGPRIWFCGSYAYEGIPLLEGCVASARLVIQEGIAGSTSSHF